MPWPARGCPWPPTGQGVACWLAFFLVRVAGVALALVSGCLSCPPGAVLVAVSASLISTAARRHDRHSNKKKKKRPGQRGAPPVAGPGAFNSCPGLGGVRGYARVGPGCQWAELAWATRDWMWTHSPLAPHHQPPVPVPVLVRARRTAPGQLRATCRCRARERQGLTNHLHVFSFNAAFIWKSKGFQTCFLHRVALLLAPGAGVGGAVITLAIAR